jgi:hypothetical protein
MLTSLLLPSAIASHTNGYSYFHYRTLKNNVLRTSFRQRITLKKVTFNVTVLVKVFKVTKNVTINVTTVFFKIRSDLKVRYGDASGINSIEKLYKFIGLNDLNIRIFVDLLK